jgi:hypothetical protein
MPNEARATQNEEKMLLCSELSQPPPPHLGPWGEPHSLAGKGVGGPKSDNWTGTLVLFMI